MALWSLYLSQYPIFLVLFLLGILSDALDGPIARKMNQTSLFGRSLDKLSDQFFEVFLAAGLWFYSSFPSYYFIVLLVRVLVTLPVLRNEFKRAKNQNANIQSKREIKVSSVLSLSVFFFYALAMASQQEAPALAQGLLVIALPYVLLPLGALMEGINILKFFPQLVRSPKGS